MEVDVVPMRDKGVRRQDQLRPIRGHLTITTRLGHREGQPVALAQLTTYDAQPLLPVLDCVQIRSLSGGKFLLVGIEERLVARQRENFKQAWWCRIVTEGTRYR